MLPATLVTFATFLLELCTTSPVYNMQPAFITANIGTTGRNIRNLPCISRKSNQSGVCMFAIDCLKSNGTHLGTCIDRFYFGSCCHIEPIHNIIENTIDTDIIPAREPPHRLTSTLRPLSTTIQYKTNATPLLLNTTTVTATATVSNNTTTKPTTKITTQATTTRSSSSSSIITRTTTAPTTTTATTATTAATTAAANTVTRSSTSRSTTSSIISTTSPPTSTSTAASSSQSTTPRRILTTISTSTTSPKPTSQKAESTTVGFKLSTFQSVESSSATATTDKIIVPISTTAKTSRPKPSSEKPRPSIKTTSKPKPSRIPTKPTRITTTKSTRTTTTKSTRTTTTKPTRTTTKRASITTSRTTRKPTGTKPTKRITTVTAPEKTSSKPTTETTRKPALTTKPSLSTSSPKPPVILHRNSTTQENETINEIETSSTTKATIVTWTVADVRNSSTSSSPATTAPPGPSNSTSEEWVPLTTPDGWVLLPSVPSTTTGGPTLFTTINQEPATSAPVSTLSPPPPPLPSSVSSTSSTQQPSTTTESASKPSITYIPLETTTSTTLNTSSSVAMATEGASTQSTPVTSATPPSTSSLPPLDMTPVNMSDFTDVCGRRMYPEARIVGGEKSSFGKWPWQISLRQWRTSTYLHKCGAALLNENWAITAAHCVDNVPPSDLLLRLGEHDLSTESEPYLHQERRVQIVASHPQFDPRTFEYDLALLRFYEPVTFQPNILPVCVPQTDENFVGRTAYVTGWGRLYEDGPLPSVLQEVSVPVINNSVCESMYRAAGYIEHIPHIFICAGWRRGGFDSCEGDSGGPMVIQRDDRRFLLAGVISWGIGCAEPNQPGVYTRISEFRDWINQILQF